MNIKSRIRKIEQATISSSPAYCLCFDRHLDAAQANDGLYDLFPENPTISGICRDCGKPISPKVGGIYENLLKIYGEDQ